MKRIKWILTGGIVLLLLPACLHRANAQEPFSSFDRAKLHSMTRNRPATDFFEGALLGGNDSSGRGGNLFRT